MTRKSSAPERKSPAQTTLHDNSKKLLPLGALMLVLDDLAASEQKTFVFQTDIPGQGNADLHFRFREGLHNTR